MALLSSPYGPLSSALSPDDNGYCAESKRDTGELAPPALEPNMLDKGLLNTSEGDPDPLRIQHPQGENGDVGALERLFG